MEIENIAKCLLKKLSTKKWKSLLKEDPVEWLLEEENPSVRYWTLKDILERPESDPEVIQAKQEIMISSLS